MAAEAGHCQNRLNPYATQRRLYSLVRLGWEALARGWLGRPVNTLLDSLHRLSQEAIDNMAVKRCAGLPLERCDSTATRDSLNAAARVLRGDSSLVDLIHISDFVVIAVARPAPILIQQDGFRSSIGFVVTDTLKGELQPGTKFIARQMSGKNPDGSGVSVSMDPIATIGTKYLVVGSRSHYEVEAVERGNGKPVHRKDVPVVLAYMLLDPSTSEADNIRLATSPL